MGKLITILLCIFLPPVAVFLKEGIGKHLIINIILVLFFFVPAMIHALWVCLGDR